MMDDNQMNVPDSWKLSKLGAVCKIKKGVQFNKIELTDSGMFPCINGGIEPSGYSDLWNTNENTITISEGGNSCGYINYLTTKFWSGGHCYSLLDLKSDIDNNFLYQALKGRQSLIMDLRVGSGLPNIQQKAIKEFEFIRPKQKAEQRQIATILSKVDEAISQTDKLIAKYSRIKTGLMQDLLIKGIDEHDNIRSETTHQFKESQLGLIPAGWEVEKLSRIAKVSRGKFTPRPRNNPIYYGGNYPFIQTGDISNCRDLYLDNYTQTLNDRGALVSKKFPAGTIVMSIAANIGDTAILKREMYLTDSVVGIKTELNEIYLELFFKSIKVQLENTATQSAQKNINIEKLNEVLVKYPRDKNEQLKIAQKYISIGNSIKKIEANLFKLHLLKTGLMQDLLSGNVRVNHLIKETTNV